MQRFGLNDTFQVECLVLEEVRIGKVYPLYATQLAGPHLRPSLAFSFGDQCSSKASILTGESIASCASISFHPGRCCWATSSWLLWFASDCARTDMDVGAPKRRTGRQSLWRCLFRRLAGLTRRSGEPLAVLVRRQIIRYREIAGPFLSRVGHPSYR
jgi:hypothetical protein